MYKIELFLSIFVKYKKGLSQNPNIRSFLSLPKEESIWLLLLDTSFR